MGLGANHGGFTHEHKLGARLMALFVTAAGGGGDHTTQAAGGGDVGWHRSATDREVLNTHVINRMEGSSCMCDWEPAGDRFQSEARILHMSQDRFFQSMQGAKPFRGTLL